MGSIAFNQELLEGKRQVRTRTPSTAIMEEKAYAITILTPERASAQRLLQLTRHHWGIENGLHYRQDTTLREDQTRISQPTQAEPLEILNNFIVDLARKLGFNNLATALRCFDTAINLELNNFP